MNEGAEGVGSVALEVVRCNSDNYAGSTLQGAA